jgi:putative transposase
VAEQLVAQAREKGIELAGPNGLLSQLTKRVLETGLEAEMTNHLGYDKHDPMGRNRGNSPQRGAVQDGADRDRPGGNRGAS